VLLLSWYQNPGNFSYRNGWVLRFGPLIFFLWLAWTDIAKIPWWNWIIIVAVLLVCAVKPGFWLAGVPIIIYILFTGRKK